MGCDIHTLVEKRRNGRWVGDLSMNFGSDLDHLTYEPFDVRNYGMFAWLAGVRNYSAITPLSPPRGIPADASDTCLDLQRRWEGDAHNWSWYLVNELLAVDYDAIIEDRQVTVQTSANSWNGAHTADEGGGEKMTLREFLGELYFKDLEQLSFAPHDTRVVFFFDN